MEIFWTIFLFIIGAACGSFVGALVFRMRNLEVWRAKKSEKFDENLDDFSEKNVKKIDKNSAKDFAKNSEEIRAKDLKNSAKNHKKSDEKFDKNSNKNSKNYKIRAEKNLKKSEKIYEKNLQKNSKKFSREKNSQNAEKLWREFWRGGRSICENCGKELKAQDLIPIFSWIFLRGKCRNCKAKIGASALFLEIFVGAAFAISYIFWPNLGGIFAQNQNLILTIITFILWLIIIIFFAALLIYDAKFRLLPNKLMFPLMILALIFAILKINFAEFWPSILQILFALIPVFGVYLILYLISRGGWVGLGDVKFGIVVGLLTGDWRAAILVLILANLLGSLAVLPLLIRKKLKPNSQIAFGPFLIFATFIAVLFGEIIVDFARKILLI